METVYLLHFATPYKHAKHYLGFTKNLDARLQEHRKGTGARLMQVIKENAIDFVLARAWKGDKKMERRLKGHSSTRLCPLCNPNAMNREKENGYYIENL